MKPVVKYPASLSVFDVVILAKEQMVSANLKHECWLMSLEILKAKSFNEVFAILRKYCNLVSE